MTINDDNEQKKKDARLRSMIFSLVAQSGAANDPDKALAKSKTIYDWIKEGK